MPGKLAKDGSHRGGARPGAGRKKGLTDAGRTSWAATFHDRIGGDVEAWVQLYRRGTREQRLQILKFTATMRYGYPRQQTEITGADGSPVQIIFHGPLPPWAPQRVNIVREDLKRQAPPAAQQQDSSLRTGRIAASG